MLELGDDQIHLWLVFAADVRDAALLTEYRALLNEEERAQEKRFYFAKDQHRYLLTRALVRTTLSRYLDVEPAHWIFSKNAYGRPEIVNDVQGIDDFTFNLTHTDGLIMLGVARGCELGVDVENQQRRQVSDGIAERFFSRSEARELYALPVEQQTRRFFEYWTLKESYIKARGMGLSIPLDQFSFYFPAQDQVEIEVDPRQNDSAHWSFWQLRLTPQYLAAVCATRAIGLSRQLIVKKITPLANGVNGEQAFDYTLVRQSR